MASNFNGLRVSFTDEGELVIIYPEGISSRTGIFASSAERRVIEDFVATTSGRTLLMQQRGREIRDPLTGLLRRQPGRELIDQQIERIGSMPLSGTVSVLVMDLDHFGRLNKDHGITVGDEILRWFARILTRRTRSSDVVVRWGGEEFVVFTSAFLPPADRKGGLPRDRESGQKGHESTGVTDDKLSPILQNGTIVAKRIQHSLAAGPCMVGGVAINQGVTIGVATHIITPSQPLADGSDGLFDRLFEQADSLLRKAKVEDQRGRIFAINESLKEK